MMLSSDNMTSTILPLSAEPFTPPTDRDMLPSERREFVRTHRTCVFGTPSAADGPAMSVVYYVPTDTDELLVSTMRDRGKAKAVARDPKASLCVLDETLAVQLPAGVLRHRRWTTSPTSSST